MLLRFSAVLTGIHALLLLLQRPNPNKAAEPRQKLTIFFLLKGMGNTADK